MKIHHRLERKRGAPFVLAIGFFDGFHLGHQEIVRQLHRLRKPGMRSGVLTFSNHPATFLRAHAAPPLITTLEERIDLLGAAGVDECFLLPFNDGIASLEPHEFIENVLIGELRVQALVVGMNFRFGKGRTGDVDFARAALAGCGAQIVPVDNQNDAEGRISSTRIRAEILAGRVHEAERLLGHAWSLRGIVRLGEGRGHDLGFPTANLALPPEKMLPKDGVYAAVARHDGRDYAALVSIGTNPTFEGTTRTVEAWMRDFHATIYGQEVTLRDLRFVRDQVRYSGVEELLEQMERDRGAIAYPSYG